MSATPGWEVETARGRGGGGGGGDAGVGGWAAGCGCLIDVYATIYEEMYVCDLRFRFWMCEALQPFSFPPVAEIWAECSVFTITDHVSFSPPTPSTPIGAFPSHSPPFRCSALAVSSQLLMWHSTLSSKTNPFSRGSHLLRTRYASFQLSIQVSKPQPHHPLKSLAIDSIPPDLLDPPLHPSSTGKPRSADTAISQSQSQSQPRSSVLRTPYLTPTPHLTPPQPLRCCLCRFCT